MIKNLFNILNSYSLFKWLPDKLFLKMAYRLLLDKKLDLENPTTFNEKIQWLKLYNRKAIYTTMVDKYEAKNYVASVIGNEYVIPTLGVWDSFNDIDFNTLPNQFVLKCTHDSGGLVICKDKNNLNLNSAKMKIERCLKRNYYWAGREWPYKNIKPRIIAETYMEDHSTSSLYNYKFFCFNGVAKCYKVDFDRFIEHKANRFTSDGELMKFGEEVCQPDFNKVISVSIGFDKIKKFAEKLSSEQPFLRADFYDREGKIYFGELTFYPASGFGNFNIDGKDELIGSWIQLSKEETGREKMFLIYEDMLCILNRQAIEKKNIAKNLADYKIHSFNGKPKVILVCKDRFSKTGLTEDFYDQNWFHFSVKREHAQNSSIPIERPKELDKILELATKLSKDIPFLRSDFYIIDGKVYFGELTFYPASGFEKFVPASFDKQLGDWIKLPEKM